MAWGAPPKEQGELEVANVSRLESAHVARDQKQTREVRADREDLRVVQQRRCVRRRARGAVRRRNSDARELCEQQGHLAHRAPAAHHDTERSARQHRPRPDHCLRSCLLDCFGACGSS